MNAPKWQRNEDWIGSTIDDAFVMVNIDTGTYVALNATAGAVWEAMAAPVEQTGIEQALLAHFAVSAEACHGAVTALLTRMQELQLAAPV